MATETRSVTELKTLVSKYRYELLLTAVFIIAVAAAFFSGVHCLFEYVTGIPCPTCGMTRAFTAFFTGNIGRAFYFHPLFPTIPFIYLMLVFRNKLSKRLLVILTVVILGLFFTVYFMRMFVFSDSLIYYTKL